MTPREELEEILFEGTLQEELLPKPLFKPYDPQPAREWTRVALAVDLGIVLVGLIVAFFYQGLRWVGGLDDLIKLSGIVLSPMIGIFGTVLGFYSGSQSVRG
ncbi:hypothetical protein [Thermus sp.]|uniref:hypothetical protein n=1 Tax=Thermus sp. TaxID=275 RepID=UPI0025EA222F|nr:hypothetical protein [Thermus sp.]MCS6867587.1 hypothetical protein [Thermus sp.]